MKLEKAKKIADQLVEKLTPYCSKTKVAGSIRRRKPQVRDIDMVLIPSDPWGLNALLKTVGAKVVAGGKLSRFILPSGIQVDLYFATDETWATLLLIRTGPKGNNIRLCSIAKRRGWHLSASGQGLFNEKGERIAGDSERSIYDALKLKYQEPRERK